MCCSRRRAHQSPVCGHSPRRSCRPLPTPRWPSPRYEQTLSSAAEPARRLAGVSPIRRKARRSWPPLAVMLSVATAASCVQPPPEHALSPSCLLPEQQPMMVAELFFGLGIAGREPLTEPEWAEFVAQTITPNFPDGFTVFDGQGQWRDPRTGRIAGERTKVLLVAAKSEPDLARRLSAVVDVYKTRFHQQLVGLISTEACANF